MTRESEARLLDFCVSQHGRFDRTSWLAYEHPRPEEFLVATLFLAGAEWFGHSGELEAAAECLSPGARERYDLLLRRTDFDCARFSQTLRRRLEHAAVAS